MDSRCRSGSDLSDRPTLPPIRDLFRDELSNSRRPQPDVTNSPSYSFARLSFSDEEDNSRQNPTRTERRPSQTTLPISSPALSPFMRPRSSSNLPTLSRSEIDRNFTNHPLSRSYTSPGHFKSKSSNDIPFQQGAPSSSYRPSSGRSTPSNGQSFLPVGSPGMSAHRRSYSRGGSPYDPRPVRAPDAEPTEPTGPPYFEGYSYPPSASTSSMRDNAMQDAALSTSASKYECSYCGKGFNRPSSLKIHLNSHTGEKPFTCPFEGCGRSFSVLSNMRRHARVHNSVPRKMREGSSDDGSDEHSPSLTVSSHSPVTPAKISPATPSDYSTATPRPVRRDSNASSMSSRSRSRSASPDGDNRPEKRFRY